MNKLATIVRTTKRKELNAKDGGAYPFNVNINTYGLKQHLNSSNDRLHASGR